MLTSRISGTEMNSPLISFEHESFHIMEFGMIEPFMLSCDQTNFLLPPSIPNLPSPPPPSPPEPVAKNCIVSEWSDWGPCSECDEVAHLLNMRLL